jgi:D-threo-aldose 1-dehydrogenase
MQSMVARIQRRVTRLGFGGAPIGNLFQPVTDSVAHATVQAALSAGIRHVDTAPHYGFGLSESRLGASLAHADPQREVVLSTKVGRRLDPRPDADLSQQRQGFVSPQPFESVFDYSYDGVMSSYEESRARLRREIDILYVHDLGRRVHGERHPALFQQFMAEGYRALRELRDAGAVGAIGLGVNEWEVCEEALDHADFDVVLLAGRYTLLEQGAVETFLPLCQRRGVSVVVGGPYNSGILVHGVRTGNASTYDYQLAPPDVLARVAQIENLCDRCDVPLAAAALQFPLAHPQVISVIPGMGNPDEVHDAQRWLETEIPDTFWRELRESGLVREDAPLPAGT